jgi:hypothetical protein
VRTQASPNGLVLIFIACILTLTPLAYASPPDPTWQLGFFDDDDFDEVVGYITSAAGLAEAPVVRCRRPVPILVRLKNGPPDDPVPFSPLSSSDPRAPPTIYSPFPSG